MTSTYPVVASNRTSASPALLYALLGLIGLLAVVYQSRLMVDIVSSFNSDPSIERPFQVIGSPPRAQSVAPEAKRAGISEGDVILSVDGQPLQGINTLQRVFHKHVPGDLFVVEELHQGVPHRFTLRLAASSHGPSPVGAIIINVGLGIVLPWFSLLLGLYVAALRVRDPLAWIVFAMLLSFSHLVSADLSEWGDWIRIPAELFHTCLFTVWPLCFLLFCVYFPTLPQFLRNRRWILVLAIFLYLLPTSLTIAVGVGYSENLKRFAPLQNIVRALQTPYIGLTFTMVVSGIVLLGIKARRETRPDGRRRLRLLVAGVLVGLAPIIILILFSVLRHQSFDTIPPSLIITTFLLLILFPATLAYVIVIDRAMDVRLVVRQGLQYAFAKNGIVVLRSAVLIVFTIFGFQAEKRFHGNLQVIVPLAIVLAGAVLLINFSAKRLGRWVDRRFFRDAYNAESVLTELTEQVRAIRSAQPLMETVCQRIADTLHVEKLAVLLQRNGDFCPFYARGFDEEPHVQFPENSSFINHLRHAKEAPRVYFEDEDSWIYRTPGLDDEQRQRLARLQSELLLPLSAGESLLGFISAGPKRSEEPYSKSDVRILSSVAAQTGLALENAQLTTAIASEMAHRERLAREVEIAREVQERLFPQILQPLMDSTTPVCAAPRSASAATTMTSSPSPTAASASPSVTLPVRASPPRS